MDNQYITAYPEYIGKLIIALEEDTMEIEEKRRQSKTKISITRIVILFILLISLPIILMVWIEILLWGDIFYGILIILIWIGLIIVPLIKQSSSATVDKRNIAYHDFVDKHYNLVSSLEDINSIGDIINFISTIISLFEEMKESWIWENVLYQEQQFIYLILKDTSRILDREIKEHVEKLNAWKKILDSTKWESVPIFTLQQARLDKQIEQFEELQRVLVKV